MKRILSMVAAMAVVSSMALGASAALEAIPDGWVFDPEYYAAQNPDVVQVVGTDTMALYDHYRQSGNKEGRKPYDESVYSKDDVKRFYAENFKRSDEQPIEIMKVIFTVNSAGGVSPIVLWNNNTGKTIKYIRFYMEPYNAVDDPVEDQVTGNKIFSCRVTGPIDTEKGIGEYIYDYYGVHYVMKHKDGIPYYDPSFTVYKTRQVSSQVAAMTSKKTDITNLRSTFSQISMWNAAWYNSTTDKIKISRVDVDYMDGTSQTLQIASDYWSVLNGKVDCWEER